MRKKAIVAFKDYEATVRIVRENHPKLNGAHGMTYFDECEIYVRNNLSETLMFRTLIHELTHFALYAYDMSADDAEKKVGFRNEEQLCRFAELAVPEIYMQAWSIMHAGE